MHQAISKLSRTRFHCRKPSVTFLELFSEAKVQWVRHEILVVGPLRKLDIFAYRTYVLAPLRVTLPCNVSFSEQGNFAAETLDERVHNGINPRLHALRV